MFGNQSLIHTRIIPPRRRKDLVERTRLNQLLGELVEKRLVLVSAPAGYGKTSLLVDFVSQCNLPICWYSIDRLDFDPLRFIAYFASAIQKRFPAFGQRTAAALSSDQGKFDGEYIATVVINDIYENISEHFIIILDDYHLVNDSLELRNFISKLLLDLDENCHFILASRTLLSLPVLPILVARSEVGGLSYEELGFDAEEIQQLFQQNQNQVLSLEIAKDIQNQTEGWITGIILTSQVNDEVTAARERLIRVSGFSLNDYFSQIIDHLPVELRSFLLWSSLLEEFNGERCAEVIGPVISREETPWTKWVIAIQQNNLFNIPVGEQGDWIRYHPLFLEFLQNKIFQESPDLAHEILYNLAKHCIQKGDWDQAFSIYRRINFTEDLILLIENFGLEMILRGRISTLSGWLDSLPPEILNTRPYIVAIQGNIAMVLGDTSLALPLYNRAIDAMDLSTNRLPLIHALSMRAAALRVIGKLDEAKKDASDILSLAGDEEEFVKMKGEALRCIGLCYFHQGKLQNALAGLEEALNFMQSINDQKNIAIIQLEIGLIHENQGNYLQAENYYQSVLKYWKSVENPFWLSNILNNLGVLQQLMGNFIEANHSFEEGLKFARSCGYARMEAYLLTGLGDIYAEIQADEQAAQAYYLAEDIAESVQEHFLQIYIKVQKAALAGHSNDIEGAYIFLNQAQDLVGTKREGMEQYLIDLERSGIRIKEKQTHEVIPTLEKVLVFFEKEGHKIQFEKTHLFLALTYLPSQHQEKVIEHLLHIFSSLESEFPPSSLIAVAVKFINQLKTYVPHLMQKEYTQFILQIEKFQKTLPVIRRELRKFSHVIPFSVPTIIIKSLGRMQVKINKKIITSSEWQTQAARDLLFMLLAHPEGMTKEEICLIFWPDASTDDAKYRFKNTIYRLRRAAGKNSIILDQNLYYFNNKLDYEYDVELFLKENALANKSQDTVERLSHFREAIKYYGGSYLSEINQTWVYSPREYLGQIFLNILLQVSLLYFDQSNFELALEYCQRALSEDNLMEDAHRQAMRIFAAMGNRVALVQQYQRCVEIFKREINAPPSPQTHELFELLIK
ncbi:MAG: tetratricopeptide repeat protein [Anaerolineaceae bacterium]|nr:tetratricopeptide repeat protein [Anaerolineaceae bacterium]